MHLFTGHRRNTLRYFANFDLPDNPLCWAFGHSPRAEVQESKYAGSTWVLVECRWCGRRLQSEMHEHHKTLPREEQQAIAERRIENARRDPVAYAANFPRRQRAEARLELSLETVDRREHIAKQGLGKVLLDNLGVSVRVGTRHSESPYHVHVDAGVFGVYASAGGVGHRFAHWIGRGHKRELSLQLHGGHLWWKAWYNDDGGNDAYHRCDSWRQPTVWPWSKGRRKHRGWMCLRSGNVHLNPLDELWGRPYPERVLLEEATLVVPMDEFPGDTYLIDAKCERWEWARKHGPAWARKPSTTFSVDWRSEEGIPTSNDDWKGDKVLGSGVSLKDPHELADWKRVAVARVVEHMKRDRRRNRYVPPAATHPSA